MTATIEDAGPVSSLERKMAFLTHGPKMVQWLSETGLSGSCAQASGLLSRKGRSELRQSIDEEVFDEKKLGSEGLLADRKERCAVATYAGESTVFLIFMQTWGLFFLFLKIATVRTVVWRALGGSR
jgi:hypothetical protein